MERRDDEGGGGVLWLGFRDVEEEDNREGNGLNVVGTSAFRRLIYLFI